VRTTCRSISLDIIGVIEMGRYSVCCLGADTLGIGRILSFHCLGTVDVASDMLNRQVIFLLNMGAATRRYHAGSTSSPAAVGSKWSSI